VDPITKRLRSSGALARVAPFVVFVLLTCGQGQFGEGSRYWLYLAKTIVGAWMLWNLRPAIAEMRWAMSWEAVVAGIAVFVIWVGLDPFYPSLDQLIQQYLYPLLKSVGLGSWCGPSKPTTYWNPKAEFGRGSALAWLFVGLRIAGSSIVVPPIEEVFYRSFLYRYIARPNFESVPLGAFLLIPFAVTALIFGFGHHEWLAGILCACIYQGLVCWKKRLGDAMTAHAITNFLLGVWVVWKGAWWFW
jgi:uncharacterized protein